MTMLKTSFANVKKNILKTAPLIKFPILNNKESRLALLCKVDNWEPSEVAD